MKFKYFICGLGTGIVFAALILCLIPREPQKLASDEIIEKARSFGMVMQNEASVSEKDLEEIKNKLKEDEEKPIETNITETPETVQNTDNSLNTKDTAEVKVNQKTEDTNEVNNMQNTEEIKETKEMMQTKAEQEKKTAAVKKTANVTVKIEDGMYAKEVVKILKQKDLIDDVSDFNQFLMENKYQLKINVGTFEIPKGSDYSEIARIITRTKKK